MPASKRPDQRRVDQLRPVRIQPGYVRSADGSCLIELGGTRVICTASFSPGVKAWRKGSGLGWVTAEYGMLPASTGRRKARPGSRPDSRGVEIQRLIGRTLRNVVRFERLGENTITIDCDVLEADGGTRTAAITGGYVALALAARRAAEQGACRRGVLSDAVAAVSVGIDGGRAILDLDYVEDSRAEVDMNVAMNGAGAFIEIQGTGERNGFNQVQLARMLALAGKGIRRLLSVQRQALGQRTRR